MRSWLLPVALLAPAPALAQHADHAAPAQDPHAGMDHGSMDHGSMDHGSMDHGSMDHGSMNPGAMDHAASSHIMTGALGGYGMTPDASGTAWQPDSAPMAATMFDLGGGWSGMAHGFATLTYDRQGGPRGDEKVFVGSMGMVMAQRQFGGGTLTLRGGASLDPLMGKRGYPLLLASGETADGRTELIDRQHPHDLFTELSATYSVPLAGSASAFLYLGLPGEPALGPATYMHRLPGLLNPEAPIGHHWLDATHVTFGVATAGLTWRGIKLEASLFTGREPDQHRYDIEEPRFDSWSLRATWNPAANLSMQLSHALLRSPEQLHPDDDVRRTTASLTHNLPFDDGNWQTTLAWGRNVPIGTDPHGVPADALLAETAVNLGRHAIFARGEVTAKSELFPNPADPLHDRLFKVGKASLGYFHTVPVGDLRFDLGGLVSRYALPGAIQPAYGRAPTSFMLFARMRLGGPPSR